MTTSGSWPFTDVRTVERRGDLLVLAGTAPDGTPVTITRLAPGAAAGDQELRRRFAGAVARTARLGPHEPQVAWAETDTLAPWAATYDDPGHRGSELIAGFLGGQPAAAGPPGPVGLPGPPGLPGPAGGAAPASVPVGPPPAPRRGLLTAPAIGAVVAGVVVVVALLVGVSVYAGSSGTPGAGPTPGPSYGTSGPGGPSYSPLPPLPSNPQPTGPSRPTPKLRHAKPVSVYGPVWHDGDATRLIDFSQLGWAFRVPADFDCLVTGATDTVTEVTCLKLFAAPDEMRRITIIDQTCAGKRCSRAEKRRLNVPISSATQRMKRKDATTRYLVRTFDSPQNGDRYFGFDMGHYHRDGKDRLRKHVSVYAEAPVGPYAKQLQKTVNDIRTQTG